MIFFINYESKPEQKNGAASFLHMTSFLSDFLKLFHDYTKVGKIF